MAIAAIEGGLAAGSGDLGRPPWDFLALPADWLQATVDKTDGMSIMLCCLAK